MVKMILELMAMEEELKKGQDYLRQLNEEVEGLQDNPSASLLQDRLVKLEWLLQDILTQWPHLGLDLQPREDRKPATEKNPLTIIDHKEEAPWAD